MERAAKIWTHRGLNPGPHTIQVSCSAKVGDDSLNGFAERIVTVRLFTEPGSLDEALENENAKTLQTHWRGLALECRLDGCSRLLGVSSANLTPPSSWLANSSYSFIAIATQASVFAQGMVVKAEGSRDGGIMIQSKVWTEIKGAQVSVFIPMVVDHGEIKRAARTRNDGTLQTWPPAERSVTDRTMVRRFTQKPDFSDRGIAERGVVDSQFAAWTDFAWEREMPCFAFFPSFELRQRDRVPSRAWAQLQSDDRRVYRVQIQARRKEVRELGKNILDIHVS
ncbi:hypothetical protein DFH06DRAFT_1144787 [Mycena polygramma]|nr:hypothetical protein DFH06DRAFT_1144787 [Mycena polygramma]